MNTIYQKTSASKEKSRKTPQQLWLRTPQELKDRYDTRSFAAKLKRAKLRIAGLPWFMTNGKVEKNYLGHFVTPRKDSTSYNDIVSYKYIYTSGIALQEKKTIKGNQVSHFGSFRPLEVSQQTDTCKTCQRALNRRGNNYIRERYKYCWDCMTPAERGCYSRDTRAYKQRILEDRVRQRQEKIRRQQRREVEMINAYLSKDLTGTQCPIEQTLSSEIQIPSEFLQFWQGGITHKSPTQ